ncbi:Calcineurin-like phosphoesterase superfamily domain protein [uncultured archaeon]|nr:Calcineurin-like phosphoesterase superfamily domain protein [uncultured archaeon]
MKPFVISQGIEAVGLTLHLTESNTLVLGDLQLGYESELRASGVLLPDIQYKQVLSHITAAVEEAQPQEIILNGDVKHSFGSVSPQEWREVKQLFAALKDHKITVLRGNHDPLLPQITKDLNIQTADHKYLPKENAYITHGHRIPDDPDYKKSEIVIIGHDHPALGVSDGVRTELVKCFLTGRYEGKRLIVLPSITFLTEGTDLLKETPLSPFLSGDIREFKAYAYADGTILPFGKLKDATRT